MELSQEEKRFIELAREKKLALNSSAIVLIETVQEFRPYESVTITKDQTGKPHHYLVSRSQKIVVSETVIAVK